MCCYCALHTSRPALSTQADAASLTCSLCRALSRMHSTSQHLALPNSLRRTMMPMRVTATLACTLPGAAGSANTLAATSVSRPVNCAEESNQATALQAGKLCIVAMHSHCEPLCMILTRQGQQSRGLSTAQRRAIRPLLCKLASRA